jgi:hypothetical protein
MKKNIFFIFFSLTFLISGCDDDFSIVSDYKEQLVVFLVLDNRCEHQIIKIQKLQDGVNQTSDSKLLSNLTVKLVDTYGVGKIFKDTIIAGVTNFNVLYLDSLDLKPGVYSLFVNTADKLYAWSDINIPGIQTINYSKDNEKYKVHISISASERGYLLRTFINFQRYEGNTIIHDKIEVPYDFGINGNDTVETYPRITRIDWTSFDNEPFNVSFSALYYTKEKLKNRYKIQDSDIGETQFFAYSYDWNLFEYLNSYSGFGDEFSVRLDIPNFTNINWGNGVFGAIRVDSLTLK